MIARIKSFLFENKSARQTVAKNTFWMSAGEIGSRVLRALIVIVAARYLGAEKWGAFSYAINLAAIFTLLTDIGLSAILIRETVRDPKMRGPYLSTAFFIRITLLTAGILFLLFVGPHFISVDGVAVLLPIVGFILAFDGLREFFFSLTRAAEKMEWEAAAKIFTNFLIAVLGIIFIIYRPTAESLSWSYLIGSGLGFMFTIYALRHQLADLFKHFTPSLVKPILTSAWPFALAGIFSTIMVNTDLFLLGFWRDAKEIGYYSAALRPVGLLYMLPAMFATAVFPALTRRARDSKKAFANGFLPSIRLTIVAALPLMVGGIILSTSLTQLLFGKDFMATAPMMSALLLTLFTTFPGAIIVNALYASYQQKQIMWFVGAGAIANTILDILFIPRWGGVGSAYATLIAQWVMIAPAWLLLAKNYEFSPIPPGGKAIAASLVMGIAVFAANSTGLHVLLSVFVGALVYFASLIAMKDATLREIRALLSLPPTAAATSAPTTTE